MESNVNSIIKPYKQSNINDNSIITSLNLIEVDGSILEGGGQILRISLALAVLFRKGLHIYNIRAGRSNPGLQRQHISSANILAELTGFKLENLQLSSKELLMKLGELENFKKNLRCDCNGAGSIGLVIQQILPVVLFSLPQSDLEIVGGTIVSHAPPTFYINDVFIPIIKRYMNIDLAIDTKRHGIFPSGGGIVNLSVECKQYINPITITKRGKLIGIVVRVVSTENFSKYCNSENTYKEIFKETKKHFKKYLKSHEKNSDNDESFELEELINIDKEYIVLKTGKNVKAYTLFGQILLKFEHTIISVEHLYSEKLEKPELTNFSMALIEKLENLLQNENECLDEFTVDHLIIFMALAKGRSKIHIGKISFHTLTAIEIITKFIPSIEFEITSIGNENIIEVEGISWKNENFT